MTQLSFLIEILNFLYILSAVAVAVYANRLFRSRPIGLWGDIMVAVVAVAAFLFFLKPGYDRALLEIDDTYPQYFSLAFMPVVAFVAIGFVRSIAPLLPTTMAQSAIAMGRDIPVTAPAMAMPGAAALQNASAVAADPVSAPIADGVATAPAKPQSRLKKRLTQAFWIGMTILLALVGLARFVGRNDLPGCSAQNTKETIAKIYQPLKVEFKRYDKVETKSSADDLISCSASVTLMNDQHAHIEYDITREDGGMFNVKITAARNEQP